MNGVLNQEVRIAAEDLRRKFVSAQPFRHVVIDRFLEPEFCEQLIAEFPHFDPRNAVSETGDVGGKAVFSNLADLSPAFVRFDNLMRDREFLSLIGAITEIPKLLYDPEYIGGGTHDNQDGQELDSHVDFNYHPRTQNHRRLNLIVFLNPQWQESWGGCLELLRGPWATGEKDRQVVLPIANRCVIFETSEASWHGFRRIQLPAGAGFSRRSIAVYFYTRDRPVTEAAPPHATFYFQRAMPEHMRPGYTLRDEDVREIQTLFERRDQTIQFLYHRETEFSEALANARKMTESKAYRMGLAMAWPVRTVRRLLGRRD